MPMTKPQAKYLLGVLLANWPEVKLPPPTLTLYLDHLLDFDLEPAARAINELVATETWLPKVAELRKAITRATDPDPIPDPDQAWGEVMANARDGIYGTPIWSHPAVHDTVKAMGGIRVFAVSENIMAERAHFLRLYETCKTRAERAKQLPSDEHVTRMLEALSDLKAIEGPK